MGRADACVWPPRSYKHSFDPCRSPITLIPPADIMVATDIPQIQFTPIDDIQQRVAKLKKTFVERKTRSVEFRLVQLRKLYWA